MALNRLFVYGTLKKGHGNHSGYLSHAKYIGEGTTTREMWGLMDLGYYPAMTYGGLQVQGEVYEVTDYELSRIDRLEGVEWGYYQRHEIMVDVDGESLSCHTYLMLDVPTMAKAGELKAVW